MTIITETEPTWYVVDAAGKKVSGPWFHDQAERLAKRGWVNGYEHYISEDAS